MTQPISTSGGMDNGGIAVTAFEVSSAIMATMDALAILACLTIVLGLLPKRQSQMRRMPVILTGLALLSWGVLWTWFPPLAAWRLGPSLTGAPSAVPTLGLILLTVATLTALAVSPIGQRRLASSDRRSVLALGPWRAIFGIGLLATGLAGGLPSGFFWTAAIGDMLVGVLAMLLLIQHGETNETLWRGWNVLGLADLLHVIAVAAVFIPPFVVANAGAPTLNLVPLVVVPAFIALHAGMLRQSFGGLNARTSGMATA